MTSSPVVALTGRQKPRVESRPAGAVSTSGPEAAELAALAGLVLDPWQRHVLDVALGEREDGSWAAYRTGLVVPRQNGKTATLQARMLASLFLFEPSLTVFSAHQFSTARRTFLELVQMIRETPALWARVGDRGVAMASGREGIRTKTGAEVSFVARSKSSARGYSASCVILDEAYDLADETMNAMTPTLAAQPNPQIWFASSPVNQQEHDYGLTLARVREAGIAGDDPRLAYFEWSVDEESWRRNPLAVVDDRELWAQANPALGDRIAVEFLSDQRHAMSLSGFAVEHLGIGDWPSTDGDAGRLIAAKTWDDALDLRSQPQDPLTFSVDATRGREQATICVAGLRSDGRVHVEVVDQRRDVAWVTGRLSELVDRHGGQVVVDGKSSAATEAPAMVAAGLNPHVANLSDFVGSCARFHDLLHTDRLRHRGHDALTSDVEAAARRNVQGAWVYDRPHGAGSALVAAALAVGQATRPDQPMTAEAAVGQVF